MELRVLGACGSWPAPGEATSGYLLGDSGFTLAIDLGTGTFARLQELVSPVDIGAIVISHAHLDHFVDLYSLFYFRFFHPEPLPPLALYTPPGLFDAVTCFAPPDRQLDIREAFDVHEVGPGQRVGVGPFTIRTHEMNHHPATIGLHVDAGNTSLAYTADTGPTEEIIALAEDAEMLLCEATWLAGGARGSNHLSALQAGEYALAADVGTLLLTHLWPMVNPVQASAEAESTFGRAVRVARSGLAVSIGPND